MQKLIVLALLCISCTAAFSQKKEMPQWKKSVLIGSGITIGGGGMLTGMVFTLPRGIDLLGAEDEGELGAGIGLTVVGCVLLSGGIVGMVAGPIMIAHGVRSRHSENPEPEITFVPIQNRMLDKYQSSRNNQKFASFSIMF